MSLSKLLLGTCFLGLIACAQSATDQAGSEAGLERRPIGTQLFGTPFVPLERLPTEAEGEFNARIPEGPIAHFPFDFYSDTCDNDTWQTEVGPDGSVIALGQVTDVINNHWGLF